MPQRSPDNRLDRQTSPYLLQHANDPVAWQPWDETALQQAREQDKPILLSVGYSACHWCHVMAHESFQDEETARLMNQWFVSIKVDREERPDLDKIYQTAQLLITQRTGGWPLTMFLTPGDQTPFFGGTYFPPEARHGLPGFKDLLQRIHQYYTGEQQDLAQHQQGVREALGRVFTAHTPSPIETGALVSQACLALENIFDAQYGGFGNEPKFPNGHFIHFLLDASAQHPQYASRWTHMALFTLQNICRGGMYDQIRGGFYRYSVDERWMIPHFEKMAYDNASLLGLCAKAYALCGDPTYLRCASETADWVKGTMQSEQGGYYAALDADSEGEEGKYYAWTDAQAQTLWNDDYPVCAAYFGLDSSTPNFEGRHHLWQARPVEWIAQHLQMDEAQVTAAVERGKQAMLAERAQRVPPFCDQKILTSWNALMIKNMALASRLLDQDAYMDSAKRALDFIENTLWDGERLCGSHKDGQNKPQVYLDDYAFLIDALIESCQTRWDTHHFTFACRLADAMIEQFEDAQNGGFFFTPHHHESLIQRPRMIADEATPSGYGVATHVLVVLGGVLGEPRYLDCAERAIAQAGQTLNNGAINCTSLLRAALLQQNLPQTIIIRATPELCKSWLRETVRHYDPRRLCFAISDQESLSIKGLQDKIPKDDACAYWCEGTSCQAPLESFDAFCAKLAEQTPTLSED